MAVRAVTPRVVAISGHLQFYRDADGHDLEQDSRWDMVAGSDFDPDPRLDDFHQGRYVRRTPGATRRVEPSLLNESAGRGAGLDSRPALSPTSPDRGKHTPGSGTAACDAALSGAPASSSRTPAGASTPSDEQSRPGGPRDGS